MDKLRQIGAFIIVMEHGSMAAATLTQDVTSAMVGRRINALEVRLGMKLLHRSMRHIAVTKQGAVFVEQCKKMLEELDHVKLLAAEGRHKATGHPVVSTPAAFGRKHVAPHMPDFLRADPDAHISFNLTDRMVDLVRGDYDVDIRIGDAIGPNFVAVRLASNERVVCDTPTYFAKHGMPRTLDNLAHHNCLVFNLQGGQQRDWYFQQNDRAIVVRVNGSLDYNDGELLHRWMGEGLDLGQRSTWETQPELESGALMTVLDNYTLPDYDILAVYP